MKIQSNYKKFYTKEDIDSWYIKFYSAFPHDNDTDKDFLEAIRYYTASANTFVNNALRYDMTILDGDYMQPIFQKMINKLPTYHIPDNIIVYRYIYKGLLKQLCPSYPPRIGMIIQDKGFMSTTLIKEGIDDHKQSDTLLNILLEISVPAGTKGIYVGHLKNTPSEYEVILAPNTCLRVDYKVPFYNHYFRCTVIN